MTLMTKPTLLTRPDLAVISLCGPIRSENEDAALAWMDEDSGDVAAIIADGMGGHDRGREAAEIVVRTCHQEIQKTRNVEAAERLSTALLSAHDRLREAHGEMEEHTMGATGVLALVTRGAQGPVLWLGHVGDSRAYLFRGRSLYRLTRDHSLVSQMVRDGLLTEEDAFGHPDSNVIQRALGQSTPLRPELLEGPLGLDPGDRIVLCSDGLHGALPDSELLEVVSNGTHAEDICQRLSTAALEAGSEDNVSVACIRYPETRKRRPTRVDS